jgi:hypothetical protein
MGSLGLGRNPPTFSQLQQRALVVPANLAVGHREHRAGHLGVERGTDAASREDYGE